MVKYVLVIALTALAGCVGDDADADAFLDRVDAGSTWVLDPGPGTVVQGSTFTGNCPTFAAMTRHEPDDVGDCTPGCTCSLAFDIAGGDEFDSSYVEADFEQQCTDGSAFFCYDDQIESSSRVTCFWERTTETLQYDCAYSARIGEVTPPS